MEPARTQAIRSPFSAPEPDASELTADGGASGAPADGPPTPAAPPLPERIRSFLERPLFASLATIDPDGAPRQAVIWYRLDNDGRILVNSRGGRRWPANLRRDGRAAVAVHDDQDGYRWVGLTTHVEEVIDDVEVARQDILDLAWRYHPDGPDEADLAAYRSQPRITFRLAVDGVHDHLED